METVFSVLQQVNDYLWGFVVITALVLCALFFTYKIRGVQFRLWRDMFRVMLGKPLFEKEEREQGAGRQKDEPQEVNGGEGERRKIGSFHAFAVSLSSRVGTGNLAGVASAIFVGGPGAVFWMWVMALFGAATAFVEATLAQLYKKRGTDSFYGGPAYYMEHGLHRKWMGILFAVLITITFGMANQIVQSNTLCDALSDTLSIDRRWIGATLTLATLVIIFGGVKRISRFSSIVVPVMAVGYALLALVVIVLNLREIPSMLSLIVREAFGMDATVGGAVGIAITQGVKRGLFSNEAGEGSAPNAAAIASTSHPVKQGLLQALGVFTDTLVICTCTAFIILLSGLYQQGYDGIILTKYALEWHVGPVGGIFITVAIFLFAFSTLIANYFYGETNIRFITRQRWVIVLFRIFSGLTVIIGALISLQTAWTFVDLAMGAMTIVNLVAIILLSPKVYFLLNNYLSQRRKGQDPQFKRSMMPDTEKDIECWD